MGTEWPRIDLTQIFFINCTFPDYFSLCSSFQQLKVNKILGRGGDQVVSVLAFSPMIFGDFKKI